MTRIEEKNSNNELFLYKGYDNKDVNLFFRKIKDLINEFGVNEKAQKEIENYLLDGVDSKGKSSIYDLLASFNDKLKNILHDKTKELKDIIENYKNRELHIVYKDKKLNQKELFSYHLSVILCVIPTDIIISILLGKLLIIMNNPEQKNVSCNKMFDDTGKHLISKYFYHLYIEEKVYKTKDYKMFDWRLENKDILNTYNDTLTKGIGGLFLDWLRDVDLVIFESESSLDENKKNVNIIKLTDILRKVVGELKPINLPNRLPMIVPPKLYSREINSDGDILNHDLGGYLLNNDKIYYELIIKNYELKDNSTILKDNIIYDSINSISRVGYKINKDVLNFIRVYGFEYGIIKDSYVHPIQEKLNNGKRLFKWERKELEAFKSLKYLQDNIFYICDVFEDVHEFFIPVRIDYRGRLYCLVDYLNYQGTELAKSLLLFSKGEKILKTDKISINYIKIFGANCYGNGLDKKSWGDRINWVDENIDNIINFENGILLSKAESKFLFVSFCYEYIRLMDCFNDTQSVYFITHLPIQLDATCNGLQHLSMLGLDKMLAEQLNLVKSNFNENPKDLYSFISSFLNGYFNKKLTEKNLSREDRDSFNRLKSLNIQRKLIKKAVMTIPYNASAKRIIEYLRDCFEYDYDQTRLLNNLKIEEVKQNTEVSQYDLLGSDSVREILQQVIENEELLFNEEGDIVKNKNSSQLKKESWYRYKDNHSIKLCFRDFINLYYGINFILSDLFPSLNELIKFLKDVAKVCVELEISIPWSLPTGLVAKQSYMKFEDARLEPLSYSRQTFSIRVIDRDKKTNKINYDKRKQVRAFMPNLIHSLDAATLTMLINEYFNSSNSQSIFSIHDCFAVTANNVEFIISHLKLIYITIYSNKGYLTKLNDEVIRTIKNAYGDDCFDEKNRLTIGKKKIKYPDISKALVKSYNIEMLKESSYIIH